MKWITESTLSEIKARLEWITESVATCCNVNNNQWALYFLFDLFRPIPGCQSMWVLLFPPGSARYTPSACNGYKQRRRERKQKIVNTNKIKQAYVATAWHDIYVTHTTLYNIMLVDTKLLNNPYDVQAWIDSDSKRFSFSLDRQIKLGWNVLQRREPIG